MPGSSYILTAVVIYDLAKLIRELGIPNTSDGKMLADVVLALVEAVFHRTGRVVTYDIAGDDGPLRDRLLTSYMV